MSRHSVLVALVSICCCAGAAPGILRAQSSASPTVQAGSPATSQRAGHINPARVTMLRNRYHVRQIESVLARAVEHAAELMTHRLTAVSPDVMALAGSPRAQGFRIEGYGFFFAVEVPRLSDSMNWALQVLSNNRDERTLSSLRRLAEAQTDAALRADLERAMRLVERQNGMLRPAPESRASPTRTASSPAVTAASAPDDVPQAPPASVPDPAADVDAMLLADPSAAYEGEVKSALVDALLDYALILPLEPGERVTVAARDAGYIAFPDAIAEMVTVTLSVAVDDLLALRLQRIDRDEARRRVQVREF